MNQSKAMEYESRKASSDVLNPRYIYIYTQSNLPKTERDPSGIFFFFFVFTGFGFTKGCVLIKQSTKKYDRLGLQ